MSRNDPLHDLDHWPVVWRVTAPSAGSYDQDMVFLTTTDRDAAVQQFESLREGNWPVRIEKMSCGPLPDDCLDTLRQIRAANAQNPGTEMRPIDGAWSEEINPR